MHAAKRTRLGFTQDRSMIGEVAVMGLINWHSPKGSRVRLEVIRYRRKHQLEWTIGDNLTAAATIYSDALRSYDRMQQRAYVHHVIDHAEAYVDGQVHTNGCENFWSLLKRALKGTYVSIEPFHLFRYLDEQAFRFNNRVMNDAERFACALKGIIDKRLTYKALIGSELPQTC